MTATSIILFQFHLSNSRYCHPVGPILRKLDMVDGILYYRLRVAIATIIICETAEHREVNTAELQPGSRLKPLPAGSKHTGFRYVIK